MCGCGGSSSATFVLSQSLSVAHPLHALGHYFMYLVHPHYMEFPVQPTLCKPRGLAVPHIQSGLYLKRSIFIIQSLSVASIKDFVDIATCK